MTRRRPRTERRVDVGTLPTVAQVRAAVTVAELIDYQHAALVFRSGPGRREPWEVTWSITRAAVTRLTELAEADPRVVDVVDGWNHDLGPSPRPVDRRMAEASLRTQACRAAQRPFQTGPAKAGPFARIVFNPPEWTKPRPQIPNRRTTP
ncbi:MAG: hypothetical protein ACR2JF_06270 [Iamia sp.]